jgi:trimethylamine--corrinoid protein Co-methyltransferase
MIELVERRASIQPIKSKLKLAILDDDEIKGINETALNILEEVGVYCPSQKALRIFADAKANVDFDKKLVKIRGDLMLEHLKKAPRCYTLAGRRPELDAKIGGNDGTYFYCGGEAPNVMNFRTGVKRRAVKEDVANMARVTDYFPIVSIVWPTVSAGDKGITAPIHGMEALFNNTEKHVQTESVMGELPARYTIEMASVIAGGRDKLRERPIYGGLICSIAPLVYDESAIEAALAFAEAGLPVGFMSMPTMGLTVPPYQASTMAVGLAEVLSGCVLTQIAYPGTPNYITILPGVIDPRSGDYFYASAFSQITNAAIVQLAHYNGLPVLSGNSFGGNAYKLNSWQVGLENIYVALLAVMAGADMCFGPTGLMEAVTVLDLRRVVFDREIFQAIDIMVQGVKVNETTLAFDMIREVGPRGMFLGQRRTAKEMPKLWPPSILFEKSKVLEEKYRNPVEVAHEVIDWILKNHHPEPLDEKVRQELRRIVDAADCDENLKRELKGKR